MVTSFSVLPLVGFRVINLHRSHGLTRYPARLALTDLTGWRLRAPKAVLVLAAMLTGTLHRVDIDVEGLPVVDAEAEVEAIIASQ